VPVFVNSLDLNILKNTSNVSEEMLELRTLYFTCDNRVFHNYFSNVLLYFQFI